MPQRRRRSLIMRATILASRQTNICYSNSIHKQASSSAWSCFGYLTWSGWAGCYFRCCFCCCCCYGTDRNWIVAVWWLSPPTFSYTTKKKSQIHLFPFGRSLQLHKRSSEYSESICQFVIGQEIHIDWDMQSDKWEQWSAPPKRSIDHPKKHTSRMHEMAMATTAAHGRTIFNCIRLAFMVSRCESSEPQ